MQLLDSLFALAPLLLAPTAADVIVVGSPAAPTITDAVALAADGDIILLHGGTHAGFTLDGKGVCVISDGAPAVIDGPITVRNLAANQSVALQRLKVDSSSSAPISLDANAGPVWIEDSTLWAHHSGTAALEATGCTSLVVRRSELRNYSSVWWPGEGYAGARLTDCTATFFESTIVGGLGGSWFGYECTGISGDDGGDGLVAMDCDLLFVGGSVKGGTGGIGDGCDFPSHCGSGGPGGVGVDLLGASSLMLVSCDVWGGDGGPAGGFLCSAGPPGPDFEVSSGSSVNTLAELVRGLEVRSPAHEGRMVTAIFTGQPGESVLLLGSLDPGELPVPSVYGSLLLQMPGVVPLLGATLPATGELVLQPTLPMLDPTLEGVELKLQVLTFGDGAGFVLGEPATLVVLDSAF